MLMQYISEGLWVIFACLWGLTLMLCIKKNSWINEYQEREKVLLRNNTLLRKKIASQPLKTPKRGISQ